MKLIDDNCLYKTFTGFRNICYNLRVLLFETVPISKNLLYNVVKDKCCKRNHENLHSSDNKKDDMH